MRRGQSSAVDRSGVMLRGRSADGGRMQTRARFVRGGQQDAAAPVVVSRQPILDLSEQIVAFELLTPAVSAGEATASVLAQGIADIGLSRLAGEHPVHVDVTREFMVTL